MIYLVIYDLQSVEQQPKGAYIVFFFAEPMCTYRSQKSVMYEFYFQVRETICPEAHVH